MDFSPTGWGRVILWTALGAIGCVAVALFIDQFNFPSLSPDQLTRAVATDIAVPLLLAVPILFFLLSKLRELAVAHEQLRRHAATDALTNVLNRSAFTREVEEELADARFASDGARGSLLVIDADNFKRINDTYGHEHGDAALQMIARAIRSVLRAADRVGRIGGEEFAVFLPGTSLLVAEAVKAIWKPQNETPIDAEKGATLMKLIATLEEDDDVQNVYSNFDISEEDAAKIAG